MINAYPQPTSTARLNNYSEPRIQMQNYDQGDVRIDEQITAKDSVFARWSIQNTSTIAPSTYAQTTIPGISTPVSLSDEASFAGTSFSADAACGNQLCTRLLAHRWSTIFASDSTATAWITCPLISPRGGSRQSARCPEFECHAARAKPAHLFARQLSWRRPDAALCRCIAGRTPFRNSTT